MKRTAASCGTAPVDRISSTRGRSKTTLDHLEKDTLLTLLLKGSTMMKRSVLLGVLRMKSSFAHNDEHFGGDRLLAFILFVIFK